MPFVEHAANQHTMMLIASLWDRKDILLSPTLHPVRTPDLMQQPCRLSPDFMLSTNKAADFFSLGQTSLLRTKLAAHLARRTQLETPRAQTSEAQFQVATNENVQNLNAQAIKAAPNDGRISLLEANTARQISALYVGSNHVESAKIADLCKYA